MLHSLAAAVPDQLAISARDTVLPVVPMFHANAWGLAYAAALAGARRVLPGARLDAHSVLDLCSDERVTITAGVPTVWMAMLAALDAEPGRWENAGTGPADRRHVKAIIVARTTSDGLNRRRLPPSLIFAPIDFEHQRLGGQCPCGRACCCRLMMTGPA